MMTLVSHCKRDRSELQPENSPVGTRRVFSPRGSAYILLGALAASLPVANAQPTVSGNVIEVPEGDWYQVQSATSYESFCEGKTQCMVPDGKYIVINLTTGQRFTGIVVSSDDLPPASGITLIGNIISWQGNDWYQVQDANDYRSICEGGNNCTVDPGYYHIINLTTGVRIENFLVEGSVEGQAPGAPGALRADVYSSTQAEIFWEAAEDDGWVTGYDIYRDGERLQHNYDVRSYYEDTLTAGTTYEYQVLAIDNDDRQSAAASIRLTTASDGSEPEPPAASNDLVAAALPPVVDGENQISWAFSPVDSQVTLIIEPFVEMPLASNGNPARWNAMTTLGNKLFIVDEQDGRIYEITDGEATLWFDMAAAIKAATGRTLNIDNPFHGGVRSIAFHPEFASNGKLYASLLEERPANPEEHHYLSDAATLNADSVLVEWTVNTDTMNVDPASYRDVFRVGIPEYDHPIKQITFDPSARAGDDDYGLLYTAHGDGSKESTTTVGGQGNNALGKILRIDPLATGSAAYSVPGDNPFVGEANMLDEAWSIGHRNPHHPAFMQDGTLLVGEDGRDNIDEVNLIVGGGDYGWSQREGAYVQLGQPGLATGIGKLPDDDDDRSFIYPVAQYGHTGSLGASFTGQALGGGFVVENGSQLDGLYFYVDFAKSGEIFHSRVTDLLAANTQGSPDSLTVARTWRDNIALDNDDNPATDAIASNMKSIVQSANGYVNTDERLDIRFGQGPDGELYLFSKRNNMVYLVSNSTSNIAQQGADVRALMSAEASAAAPSDCLLSASPESAPFYCFSPADRRLMRIEQSGQITWQFPLPGNNATNHMESISFVNGQHVAIIADATASPDDSAFDMSLFEQTGAYIGTYHIIADIENPDGTDFAGVNLDGLDLIVRSGPVRQENNAESGYTSDLYIYGEYYSATAGADLSRLSGWKNEGAFRARLDSRSGVTLNTRLFTGASSAQALSTCPIPTRAGNAVDGCQ